MSAPSTVTSAPVACTRSSGGARFSSSASPVSTGHSRVQAPSAQVMGTTRSYSMVARRPSAKTGKTGRPSRSEPSQCSRAGSRAFWTDAVAGVHVLPPTEPAAPAEPAGGAGETLPDLELSTCAGEPVHLSDYLVDAEAAWIGVQAGWCGSCGSQREVMQALHEQLAADGLAVLLVLGEDAVPGSGQVPEIWCEKFTSVNGLSFPVLRDPGFAATGTWAGAIIPAQLVVDAQLTLVQQDTGWADWMAETYEALLSGLVE